LAILGSAPLAGFAAAWSYKWLTGFGMPAVTAPGVLEGQQTLHSVLYFAALHGAIIVLTLIAASRFNSKPARMLALGPPPSGVRAYASAILVSALGAAFWLGLMWAFTPDLLIAEVRPVQERYSAAGGWLLLPILCLAAPLSEELLFRGFLFCTIAKSRLGVAGAALITTSLWTALHVGHLPHARVQVFASGLVLSWLLVRTGSLRVPMLCHVLFNGGLSLALLLTPPLG
jgi:membrane protease YdiL (CAAX protease family)